MVLPFENRREAGLLLARALSHRKIPSDAVVLALARGGVPVGLAVAEQLHLPLDVIVARKIGVPWQPELAMGAIAGTARILNQPMIAQLGISDAELERVVSREQLEMNRREELYRGESPALDVDGKTAILVDDGLATGSTMLAAVRHARNMRAARLLVGVPVGSVSACAHLRREADELICLAIPPEFLAVGEWYREFDQVSDQEVQRMLAESHRRLRTPDLAQRRLTKAI